MSASVYTACKAAADYLRGRKVFPEKVKTSCLGVFDNGLNPYNPIEKFTLVSCSSLNIYKRVDKIIEVLKHIDFPLKWIHFGGQGDGLSVEQFKELCKKLNPNIQYEFRGAVSNKTLINFYKKNSVNLFIHLTFTEGGVPVVLQEAASFGIPMLSTKTGGVPEIVNANTGILMEKEFDVIHAARIISEYRGSSMNTIEFRNKVRKYWEENFNAVDNYKKFYSEIV